MIASLLADGLKLFQSPGPAYLLALLSLHPYALNLGQLPSDNFQLSGRGLQRRSAVGANLTARGLSAEALRADPDMDFLLLL